MELVYLWVDDYKNIKKQGFNFSPRFECKYDGENELSIDKREEYIPDFFGKNINVTAIVGKNGSGKSSIITLIYKLLLLASEDEMISDTFFNSFLIIKDDTGFRYFCYKENEKLLNTISKYKITHCTKKIDFFSIYYNYTLDTLIDKKNDYFFHLYHKVDNYTTPLLLEPKKYDLNIGKQIIDIDNINYFNNQNALRFYKYIKGDKNITDFFNPNYITLDCDLHEYFNKTSKDEHKIIKKLNFAVKDKNILKSCIKELKKWNKEHNYKNINMLYVLLKLRNFGDDSFESFFHISKINYPELFADLSVVEQIYTDAKIDEKIFKHPASYDVIKLKNAIGFHANKIFNKQIFLQQLLEGKKIKIIDVDFDLQYIPAWIDVELFDNEISIKSLSTGEKSFFTFIVNIMFHIYNLNNREALYEEKYSTINLFLDETELGLHPQWQKEYISRILKALSQIEHKKINIVFITHSPFLLSDIPQQNIIFLDTYKKDDIEVEKENQKIGNCKVVDGLKEKKQTFGANIHTLLSDSFFMDDGLMGEFAKGKVNKIIRFLNEENKFIDFPIEHIEKVINSIGEPFLKDKLLQMYSKRYPKTKEEEITELKDKLKRLENAQN